MNPLALRYPGRFIIVGKDGDSYVALYGATGRSPASLARRFLEEGRAVYMVAADEVVSKERNPELFEYPAVKVFDNGILVANGRHIENVGELQSRDARKQLSYSLSEESYEPDENKTPRITGCIVESERGADGALHIIRFASDGTDRSAWSVPFENGKGAFLSTYRGEDAKPAPPFAGEPVALPLTFGSAEAAAETVFERLSPPAGEPDYRVGVVAVYKKLGEAPEIAIVNRLR